MIRPDVISIPVGKLTSVLKWTENWLPVPYGILFLLNNRQGNQDCSKFEKYVKNSFLKVAIWKDIKRQTDVFPTMISELN